jgi:cell division protein FtsB
MARATSARIRWDRLGRWALIFVFLLVVYLYLGPARAWVGAYAQAKDKRREVAVLRAEHARLEARVRELRSPAALEREARELGMVKAGERAFVVRGLPRDGR